jgi:hypothetical protein
MNAFLSFVIRLGNCGYREEAVPTKYNFTDGVKEMLPYFLHFSSDLDKIWYKGISIKSTDRVSASCTSSQQAIALLTGGNKFLTVTSPADYLSRVKFDKRDVPNMLHRVSKFSSNSTHGCPYFPYGRR